jgi:hypothetical protein
LPLIELARKELGEVPLYQASAHILARKRMIKDEIDELKLAKELAEDVWDDALKRAMGKPRHHSDFLPIILR